MNPLETYHSDCPWCGTDLELTLEIGLGTQTYVEDCQLCCAPILVEVRVDPSDNTLSVTLAREGR